MADIGTDSRCFGLDSMAVEVGAGTPEDVTKVKESYTGQYLRVLLGRRSKASG